MSSENLFVYDYHMARDIISQICVKQYKRIKLGFISKVDFSFKGDGSQGFLCLEKGNSMIDGVLYRMDLEDIERVQKYIELQYKTKRIICNVTIGERREEKAIVFVPSEKLKPILPDKRYYKLLCASYDENRLEYGTLEKALRNTLKRIYGDYRKG